MKEEIKCRVMNNLVTTIAGMILIVGAALAVTLGKIDGIAFAEVSGLGLILAGLKDPSWIK